MNAEVLEKRLESARRQLGEKAPTLSMKNRQEDDYHLSCVRLARMKGESLNLKAKYRK